MGIYLALALSFVAKQPLNLIYDKIQNAKQRGIAPNKIGAYIRQALQNIDSDSDANQLTHADTGGRVSKNNNNEVADMGKPAAPGPSAYETRIIIAKLEMVRKASKAVVSQSRAEIKEALQKGLVKK